jgi:DNA-binding CsgD family transcriptional regulator
VFIDLINVKGVLIKAKNISWVERIMALNYDELSVLDLKNGYTYNSQTKKYVCEICGAVFEEGEIHPFEGRLFEASRAVSIHVERVHGSMFQYLMNSNNKYNTFTDKQKELLLLMNQGKSDQEIAAALKITASTVRHQKFSFREKAKQARMYLAIYELISKGEASDKDAILPIHEGATMVDDRYLITQEESDKIISTVFESLNPLKLKLFSAKEKKKIVTLRKISEQFEIGRIYPEAEVNKILKGIYEDFPSLRRYLIEYGFMERSKDCKDYWLVGESNSERKI